MHSRHSATSSPASKYPAAHPLTNYPSANSSRPQGKQKLLVLAPRKLFSSYQRQAELMHLVKLLSAWKGLAKSGRSSLDFTLLSASHPLEQLNGLHSIKQNAFFSELTGKQISSAVVLGNQPSAPALASNQQAVSRAISQPAQTGLEVNFVESMGIEAEELTQFLEGNSRDFSIPAAGWQHFPTTRSLVADSCALAAAGSALLEHGKYAGIVAIGWPVFDAALRLSKDHLLPSFYNFSMPSKLEAEVDGKEPHDEVVARELAAVRHGEGILSFDVAGLRWVLKNYSPSMLAAEKSVDFENVLEVLELSADSAGLMQIVASPHAHPHDRRSAITLLKDARSTLDSHAILHGEHFVISKYCAAFNSPLSVQDCSKGEISSAKRSLHSLASLQGPALSKAKAQRVFSLVFTDASDETLQAFSKALFSMGDAAFVVRSDSPALAGRLKKISEQSLVSHRIALMPEKNELAIMAASSAVVFPNAVSSLLHYESALSAVHSAKMAGLPCPAIVASRAAPFLLMDAAILPPAPSQQSVSSTLSQVSQGGEYGRRQPATGSTLNWGWNDAALKLVEFISGRL